MVKGQSRPRTSSDGGESRSGMNPGVGGSNPLVDTNLRLSFKQFFGLAHPNPKPNLFEQ